MSFNPVTKAVADIMRSRIPREIIAQAFKIDYSYRHTAPTTIDDQIIALVIRAKVLIDCDLVGGQEVFIRLDGVPTESTADNMSVLYIPRSLTQGRSITQVLDLSVVDSFAGMQGMAMGSFNADSISSVGIATLALNNSQETRGLSSTTRIELVGENVVLVKEPAFATSLGVLRCILANQENLNNLSLRSYPNFSKLCELAVKAYIYNKLIVELDTGKIQGGYELGVFKQIVEGYSDAEELYQEYLRTTWQKTAFMQDREQHERLIRVQLGGFR